MVCNDNFLRPEAVEIQHLDCFAEVIHTRGCSLGPLTVKLLHKVFFLSEFVDLLSLFVSLTDQPSHLRVEIFGEREPIAECFVLTHF